MKKLIVTVLLFSFGFMLSGYLKPDVYVIDPVHNAYVHNNLGLNAVQDCNYALAVSEFQIAIDLNPNTQATSVYYKNLGETYVKMGYYRNAQICFEKARKIYDLDFNVYLNLVNSYKKQHLLNAKIVQYQKSTQPLDMIMLGLLYIANGNKSRGVTKLDEFCNSQPDLFITPDVRNYIHQVLSK